MNEKSRTETGPSQLPVSVSFHYLIESLPQVEEMLANVPCNSQPGGYFKGTTTDAYDIM